jgi:CRP-like cAMP-binding protein
MISEHLLLALRKESDCRTTADIDLIASFCRLFSVFADMPEHLFESFCRIVDIEEFEPGAVIYSESDVCSHWYVLVEGSVHVCSNVHSSSPVRGLLKVGDSFGRTALQQDALRTKSVTCAAHVYVLKLARWEYQEMAQNAMTGFEGEAQGFTNAFLTRLVALPGMGLATSISRRVFPQILWCSNKKRKLMEFTSLYPDRPRLSAKSISRHMGQIGQSHVCLKLTNSSSVQSLACEHFV